MGNEYRKIIKGEDDNPLYEVTIVNRQGETEKATNIIGYAC